MDWMLSAGDNPWYQLATRFGLRVLAALLLLFIGLRVARMVGNWIARKLARSELDATTSMFLGRVILVAAQIVVLLAVIQTLGVPTTSLLAVLGAAGLAIGLAMKDSLSNIASGVLLVTLKPFRVHDQVTINGVTGRVESISIFQTRLRGADNQLITLPNSLITTDSIINLTPGTVRRIELVVGIGYGDDIDKARAIALELMQADPRVQHDPAPEVHVCLLGANSVDLSIICHVGNDDYGALRYALIEGIKKAFDRAGISFPFPQREVRIIGAAASGIADSKNPSSSQ
ncbi:MAG TPA: mechanosensitive ion channel [Dokdonella sp.]|jgi:small conductance mechanosensitive channel|nr:mechanosensitive ion channel [Dokdonella sp.]HQX34201.1 mechanosensitive ion channel [Dokdonella sp.]